MFKKILVANRAIPALRIIRTCRDLSIKTVVPYSEADRNSLPVLLADETICIGPAPVLDSYANISRLIAAAQITDCDAIHPGWGVLGADPEFAEATRDSGINFIGAPPELMRLTNDRLGLRNFLKPAGIPLLPGSENPIATLQQAISECLKIGLPVAVKPLTDYHRLYRLITKEKDIEYQIRMFQAEVRARFGTELVYLEKHLESARPIDIFVIHRQPVLDWKIASSPNDQECIAFTPADISTELRQNLYHWAESVITKLEFPGGAVIRFLVDHNETAFFSQINCELPSLHPFIEIVTGIDLVEEQIRCITGGPSLITHPPEPAGIAVFAGNLYLENPGADFKPSPSTVTDLLLPSGPHIRVESHLYLGYSIPAEYDQRLASIFAYAPESMSARLRLLRALFETRISGLATNRDLIISTLRNLSSEN